MLRELLLVVNMLICLALIGVVLMQRSEGGAFGTGNPTGLVTARGAGDLLTRTTWVLFTLFLTISLSLTLIGGRERSSEAILQRLKNTTVNPESLVRPTPTTPAPSAPHSGSPASSQPGPVQLPPLGSAAPTRSQQPMSSPPSTNNALTLPPIGAPSPAKPPAP